MLLLLDKSVFCSYIRNFVGDEVFKSFLQFSFATMLGGAIFLYMSIVKDEEVAREQKEKDDNIKREAQVSTKLALVKEVDMLYRSTKHIKRTLRSRCRTHGSNIIVEKEFFESKLDELDNIQIALEQNRETVKFTSELFDAETNEGLLSALRYSTRYLHDVFEDFEKNNVTLIILTMLSQRSLKI